MEKLESNQTENLGSRSSRDFLIGAILGGLVGAATALLFTPKSGKEIRNDINSQIDSLKNKSNYIKEIASEKGNELIAASKEKSSQLRDITLEKGTSLAESVMDKTKKLTDKVIK